MVPLQTYKIITIPSPDPLERPSASTAGGHASGHSSAVHSNSTTGSGSPLYQVREDGAVGGTSPSDRAADRAAVFAAASAAALQQSKDGAPAPASEQQQQGDGQDLRAGSAPVQSLSRAEGPASGRFSTTSDSYRKRTMHVHIGPEAEINEEEYMAGERPALAWLPHRSPAQAACGARQSARVCMTGLSPLHISALGVAGEVETLAETWMLMEYCDRCVGQHTPKTALQKSSRGAADD
jgi:hypothetical protein